MVINLHLQIIGLFQFRTYYVLYEFVIKIEILYEKQFEFQASRCEEYVFLKLVNSISNSFEYSKQCYINVSVSNIKMLVYQKQCMINSMM